MRRSSASFLNGAEKWRRRHAEPRAKRGVTLIELLVVVVIIMMVSAIVLRYVAPMSKARRLREGAREFSVMLNAARNRALETGRPAGIWIERQAGLEEAALSIAYAIEPEPYTGDFADSRVEAYIYPDPNQVDERFYVNVVAPVSGGQRNQDLWFSSDPHTQQLVRPGDRLRVNYRSAEWLLDSTANTPYRNDFRPAGWVIGIGANASSFNNAMAGKFTNVRGANGRYVIHWWSLNGRRGTFTTPGSTRATIGLGVPYQIVRQPVRSAAGALTLPEGVVIDLNYSGTCDYPYAVRWSDGNIDKTTKLPAGNAWRGSLNAPQVAEINQRPIILMFGVNGSLVREYRPYWNSSTSSWSYSSRNCGRAIRYFLIGEAGRVPANTDITQQAQEENNWLNPLAYWVGLVPGNGFVMTAENNNKGIYSSKNVISSLVKTDTSKDRAKYVNLPVLLPKARRFISQRAVSGGL